MIGRAIANHIPSWPKAPCVQKLNYHLKGAADLRPSDELRVRRCGGSRCTKLRRKKEHPEATLAN